MFNRRLTKQTKSLKERILEEAQNLRDAAKLLPDGPVRDAALRKVRDTEAAAGMEDWLKSPNQRQPKNAGPPAMRVYRPTLIDSTQSHHVREAFEKSRELLDQPPPDVFLGRKTQEPFPKDEEQE